MTERSINSAYEKIFNEMGDLKHQDEKYFHKRDAESVLS